MWRGFLRWRCRSVGRPMLLLAGVCVALAVGQPAWGQATPTITSVSFTSDPGADHTYALADEVEATVEFDVVVHVFEGEVAGQQTGELQLRLAIGANERPASYCGGSGTLDLRFCYTVANGDADGDGISIGRLSSALEGGVIEAADGTRANRAFNALPPNSMHLVDGQPATINQVRWMSTPVSGQTYGLGETIELAVEFSEDVVVILGADDPRVMIAIGESTRAATYSAGSGTRSLSFRYVVRREDRDDDGISVGPGTDAAGAPLSFVGGTITDEFGNGALRAFNALLPDRAHRVDGGQDLKAPEVVAGGVRMTSAARNYMVGDMVEATVAFDEDVYVTGTPALRIDIGGQARDANYQAGDGTPELVFRYTVADRDNGAIRIDANALVLNDGTIRDSAGLDANILFPAPGAQPGHVVGRGPSVRRIAFLGGPASGDTYGAGEIVRAVVDFDREVIIGRESDPALMLELGPNPLRRMTLEAATSTRLTFRYRVRAGDSDNDGIAIRADPLSGVIQGLDGNEADLRYAGVGPSATRKVDGGADADAPEILDLAVTSVPMREDIENLNDGLRHYGFDDLLTVAVKFSEPVYVTGTPQVRLTLSTGDRMARYARGSGTDTLVFEYRIQNGDEDRNGIAIPANPVQGGTVRDASGNAAVRTLADIDDLPAHRVAAVRPRADALRFASQSAAAGDPYGAGERIRVAVQFTEPVCLKPGSEAALPLQVGANERPMALAPGQPFCGQGHTRELAFTYTVKPGEQDTDGVEVRADALTAEVQDYWRNDWVAASPALAADNDHRVDGGTDDTPPEVSQGRIQPGGSDRRKRGDALDVDVTFSEPVFVTGSPAVTLVLDGVERTARYRGGDGTSALTFRYTVGANDDAPRVVLKADSLLGGIMDAAGNQFDRSMESASAQIRVDGVAPQVSDLALTSEPGLDRTYKRGEDIQVTVTMSEPVCVAHDPDLTLALRIGVRTRIARLVDGQRCGGRSPTERTLTFAYKVQSGDVAAAGVAVAADSLRGGALRDAVGNWAILRHPALAADSHHRVSSESAGATVEIISDPGERATYGAGDEIRVRVTFDEPVPANIRDATLALTIGDLRRSAALAAGDARPTQLTFAYTVRQGDQDDDGISIRANALTASPASFDWTLAPIVNDAGHRVDTEPPFVSGVAITSDAGPTQTYAAGDVIEIRVDFNEVVWASTNPSLRIDMDSRKPAAVLVRGTGTRAFHFAYTVRQGDQDDDGIAIDANALIGGTVVDAAGRALRRRIQPLPADSRHRVQTGFGGQPPPPAIIPSGVFITSRPLVGDTYAIGETVEVQVVFTEPVNIREVCPVGGQVVPCERPVLELAIGARSRSARIDPEDDASDTLTFSYTIADGDFDADGISIPANALTGGTIIDYRGANQLVDRAHDAVPNSGQHKVDGERPFVARAPRVTSTPASPRVGYGPGETIRVWLGFNEPVAISGAPTLRLTIGSQDRDAAFAGLRGGDRAAEFQYVVQVDDRDADGISIGATAFTGGAVLDLAGNIFETPRRLPALVSDPAHRVDGTSDSSGPVITAITFKNRPATGDSYVNFEAIEVYVRFNERVHVAGSPAVPLAIGPETRRAAYQTGDGTETIVFRYVVQPGDYDRDGISIGPNALRGANIRDDAGNPAPLTSVGLPADPARKVNPEFDADTPRVVSLALRERGPYGGGANIDVEVRFSEPVRVTGTPTLALSIGPRTRPAAYQTGSGTEMLVFRYVVQPGDVDADGITTANDRLQGGAITDFSNNAAAVWLPADLATPQPGHEVDAVPPAIVGPLTIASTPSSADTYAIGDAIALVVRFDDAVRTSGELALRVRVGAQTRAVPLATGHGTRALRFVLRVQAGDLDDNGISTPPGALTGGAVTDALGNPANLALPPLADQPKHKVDGIAPSAAIAITSSPASGDAYGPGEHIEVRLTFAEAVSAENEDALRLALAIGESTRQAALHRFDRQASRIVFRYTVQYGDFDPDGVSVEGEALLGGVQDLAGNDAGGTFNLADQADHKVDTSTTLEFSQIHLEVGGPPVQILLSDAIDYAGLYRAPSSTDPNVATARVSGLRLAISPVLEGTATISVAAMTEANIVLNFPVRVSASAAEVAVLSDALAAMGRGILASVANTIGTRLELGGQPPETGLVVGGRRFGAAGADGAAGQHFGRFDMAKRVGPLGHPRLGAGSPGVAPGLPGTPDAGFAAFAAPGPASPLGVDSATAQLWRGTSFHTPLRMDLIGGPSDASWAVWGGGDYTKLGGESEHGSYDGQMATAYLGMDARGDGWVAGGAVSHTTAATDYEYQAGETSGKGQLETTLTTVHPYVATSWAGQARAWAILGFGTGEASMEREDQPYSPEPADLSMKMALVGASGTLDPPGGFDISLRADAGAIALETSSGPKAIDELAVSTQRARVGVEFSYTADNRPVVGGVRLPSVGGYHGTFTPFVEIAARHDAGDGPTGTGGEVAAGVRYQGDSVSFEAKARSLVVHTADGYKETGASATLVVEPRDRRGWRFSVSPRWGDAAESTDVFFRSDYAARLARAEAGGKAAAAYDEWRMNARLERAMPLRGRVGQAAPFAETSFAGDTKRARAGFSFQTRTSHAGDLRFDVAGERADSPRGTENRVLVRMQGRF